MYLYSCMHIMFMLWSITEIVSSGSCLAKVGALALVIEKSATELKLKQKVLKYKSTIQIVT